MTVIQIKAGPIVKSGRRLCFEALESRQLLSANQSSSAPFFLVTADSPSNHVVSTVFALGLFCPRAGTS